VGLGGEARGVAITREQQQIGCRRDQVRSLEARAASVAGELATLEARREPARLALGQRRAAAAEANADRDRAAEALASAAAAYDAAPREIEGLEADVEAPPREGFSGVNPATALRPALDHAAAAPAPPGA